MEDLQNMAPDNQEITLREQMEQYTRNWVWFVLFSIIALLCAFLYLRYATPIYRSTATILIKDEKNSSLSELAAFQDLGLTGSMNQSGFENELLILKSRTLTERVVRELNLDVRYFSEGNIRTSELYGDAPFTVTVVTSRDSLDFTALPFYISVLSDTKFSLWEEDSKNIKEYNFGDRIKLPVGEIVVTPNSEISKGNATDVSHPIKVEINSVSSMGNHYRQAIQVEQLSDVSSVIQLSLNAANSKKAESILNELIRQYNQDAMEDRNMVAENTSEFIQGRLIIITQELDSVETDKVDFKQDHNLTDIAVEGEMFLSSASEFYKRQVDVEMKLELVKTITQYVKEGNDSDLLPTNLGLEMEGIGTSISAYNQL